MDKSRGRNHVKNKTKYKPKGYNKPASQDNVKDAASFGTTEPNNWDRYEEPIEDEYTTQNRNDLTNFAILAKAPISHGGHFQFKSDKNVQSQADLDSFRKSDLFPLNLNLVSFSLSTIPFTRRCNFDETYLQPEQIKDIDERARQNKIVYETFMSDDPDVIEKKENLQKDQDILQGIEDIPLDSQSIQVHCKIEVKEVEDLEQWLEGVLND